MRSLGKFSTWGWLVLLLAAAGIGLAFGSSSSQTPPGAQETPMTQDKQPSQAELRSRLSPMQYPGDPGKRHRTPVPERVPGTTTPRGST